MATPTMAAPTTAMAYTCHGRPRRLAYTGSCAYWPTPNP